MHRGFQLIKDPTGELFQQSSMDELMGVESGLARLELIVCGRCPSLQKACAPERLGLGLDFGAMGG